MMKFPIRRFDEIEQPSRRALFVGASAAFAWAYMPRFAKAGAGRDPRLIVINLRGGLDGLSAVAPVGDPHFAALRGEFALSLSGDRAALPLDGFFALHPAMPVFARLFRQGNGAVVHAVATPYRERSHSGGQEVLESGQPRPGLIASGWLNRVLSALPKGDRVVASGGLAIGAAAPLVLRGPAPVLCWAPQPLPPAAGDLAAQAAEHAICTGGMTAGGSAASNANGGISAHGRIGLGMRRLAQGAARVIAADGGPRIASLAFDGFDTHANEGAADGRLGQLLGGLDGAFEAFQMELGERWKDTVIIAITEFGRSAQINSAAGTDHGTASVAFIAGGAIKGGRVIADWPGLAQHRLHEARDLLPTADLRAVLGGILADHLGLSSRVLASEIFPHSETVQPMPGLIA
jgi:uncharacterized protein (DUF1501 family)